MPGIVFVAGRGLYSLMCAKDPASRVTGMALTFLPTIGLCVTGLIGLGLSLAA